MASKLGRGLSALFGDYSATNDIDNPDIKENTEVEPLPNTKPNTNVYQPLTEIVSEGTPIMPTRNEEAMEIEKYIENAIHLPTSLQITKKGGKLIIKCRTYEELDILVKKLTADE